MSEDFPICKSALTPDLYRSAQQAFRVKDGLERGTPYGLRELCMAAAQPADDYHRHLMAWAAMQIESLTRDAEMWRVTKEAFEAFFPRPLK